MEFSEEWKIKNIPEKKQLEYVLSFYKKGKETDQIERNIEFTHTGIITIKKLWFYGRTLLCTCLFVMSPL